MNPFMREESLFAVVVVVNDAVYWSVRGERENLRILYLGTESNAPANANVELELLRQEIVEKKLVKEPTVEENLEIRSALPVVPPKRPWIAVVQWTDTAREGGPETHFWIARDFKEMTNVASAGAPNQGLMIFHKNQPDDQDSIFSLSQIREIAPIVPDAVFLYGEKEDAGNLGARAGDYGAAADSDE